MNTQEQAYLEGFVKRASEYGCTQEQSLAILKKAFLGEPAYKEIPEIDEETVKNMRLKDMENFLTPVEGEGMMAHLKRNPGKYLGGALGGLAGAGAGNFLGGDSAAGGIAGGLLGAAVGTTPDAVLNLLRRKARYSEARKQIEDLQKHIHRQKHLNSEAQTMYNKHSFFGA